MIERALKKLRAWLTGSTLVDDRPFDLSGQPPPDASLLAQFIAALESEKIEHDYRELADLLWIERLAEATKEEEQKARQEFFDRQPSQEKKPAPGSKPPPAVKTNEERQTTGAALYSSAAKVVETERIPAMRVRLTAPPALPGGLAISRALKPFARRARSNRAQLLDEDATADASAECGIIVPVRKPAPERWFSVALVVEDAPSMTVWRQTASELFDLLRQHGAFYEVRLWRLNYDAGKPQLIEPSGTARPVGALRRSNRGQLVILLTDGASTRWVDGSVAETLETWGKDCSVVIAQVLSERLWPRTRLGWPETEVKAELPGSANSDLRFPNNGLVRSAEDKKILTPVPIISLNPALIKRWAKMLMQPGWAYQAAIFSASDEDDLSEVPVEESRRAESALSAEARVANFRALVSREARHLAIYLSVLPVTLPIMRLAQMTLLRQPSQEQLAELLLGGIIKRLTPKDDAVPDDEVEYDFYDGVREILEKGIYVDTLDVMLTAIGDYISRHSAGKFDITALLPHPEGDSSLPATARPFAKFLLPALKRMGLEYMIGGAFAIAAGAPKASPEIELEAFTFETVTLDEKGKEIERRSLAARQFIEDLDGSVKLKMVEIPGGEFLMGTSEKDAPKFQKEIERYWGKDLAKKWVEGEMPQHEVTVSPFYIGKFTVTQAQWRVVAGWEKVERDLDPDPSHFKNRQDSDDRPVEQVSWEDAQEFCARLAKKTGRRYRLPTEAEWEYACRANTQTPFAFGETITHETVNYDSKRPYAGAPEKESRGGTIPVGSLGVANVFGLFDMHGNVWEWCQDWYGSYSSDPQTDPIGPEKGTSRRLRGGSWNYDAYYCRSAVRLDYPPVNRNNYIGFRVVVAARTS